MEPTSRHCTGVKRPELVPDPERFRFAPPCLPVSPARHSQTQRRRGGRGNAQDGERARIREGDTCGTDTGGEHSPPPKPPGGRAPAPPGAGNAIDSPASCGGWAAPLTASEDPAAQRRPRPPGGAEQERRGRAVGQAAAGPVSSAEAAQRVGRETSRGQHRPTRRQRQAREPAGRTSEEGAETERGQVRRPATDERTGERADEDPHKPRTGRSSPAWRSSGDVGTAPTS